jgi:anthranilate/para-aminobenzoate synthase component II
MIEHFGGELGVLDYPQHGKPAMVRVTDPRGKLFDEIPDEFQVWQSALSSRLHSQNAAVGIELHVLGRRPCVVGLSQGRKSPAVEQQ